VNFEILVEGQSEVIALENILPKILGDYGKFHTWNVHKHRGKGELPDNPKTKPNRDNPTLLHNLPALLRAYGKSLKKNEAVIVLVDLDALDCLKFKKDLYNLLELCKPKKPNTLIRIAIEELEAWYLGDINALRTAYPDYKQETIATYTQDSICGTWELIADAVYAGGTKALKKKGRRAHLVEKIEWAKKISPNLDIDNNNSPSFQMFREGIKQLIK